MQAIPPTRSKRKACLHKAHYKNLDAAKVYHGQILIHFAACYNVSPAISSPIYQTISSRTQSNNDSFTNQARQKAVLFLCLKPYRPQGRTRTDTPNQKVTLCISDNCDQHSTAPEARQAHGSIISTLHKIQLIKMHTSAIGLKHKLKQLPTDITIKYKHYLTLKSFLHADHQTIPAKQQNRLQAKKYSLYVYKPNVQTVQTQA